MKENKKNNIRYFKDMTGDIWIFENDIQIGYFFINERYKTDNGGSSYAPYRGKNSEHVNDCIRRYGIKEITKKEAFVIML